MSGIARHRERVTNVNIVDGSYERPIYDIVSPTSVWTGTEESCDDIVGSFHTVNAFLKVSETNDVAVLNGEKFNFAKTEVDRKYDNYAVPAGKRSPPSPQVASNMSLSDVNNYTWALKARANPNVPHVSVAQFIGELKDLTGRPTKALKSWQRKGKRFKDVPVMIRDHYAEILKGYGKWRTPLRTISKANVAYRFGIAPMISDISKMVGFHDAVERRLEWLHTLANGETLRRRMLLDNSTTVVDEGPFTLASAHGSPHVVAKCTVTHTVKVWGVIHYALSRAPDVVPTDLAGRRKMAQQMTFGLNAYSTMAAAWELMPWSWFIDWFANVGDTIAAGNNTVPMTSRGGCIMRHLRSERRYSITQKPEWVTYSGTPFELKEVKSRKACGTFLPVALSIPTITWGQLSILGSLAVLKS